MKKLSVIILLCMLCVLSASARGKTESYLCDVIADNMPEGTAYIDMLIPLSTENVEFSSFNNANGEKYNILPNSEISTYEQDGFVSYTFHTESARASLAPFTMNENKEALFVEYLADDEGYDKGGFLEIDEFGERYKKAKFAYLDSDGNVLAVTNEIDIWNDFGYSDIFITLSGTKAICEMDKDYIESWFHMAIVIIPMVIAVAPVIAVPLGVVIATACIIVFVLKRKNNV